MKVRRCLVAEYTWNKNVDKKFENLVFDTAR